MRDWTVSTQNKKTKLNLYEYSFKNSLKIVFNNFIEAVDEKVFGHWLCSAGLPGIVWKIPVGKPKWDREVTDDPFLENSLGGLIYSLWGRQVEWVFKDIDNDLVLSIDIDQEAFLKLAPGLAFLFEDEDV